MTRVRAVLFAVVLVAASCGGSGASTPREALERLRAALSAGDGAAYYALIDTESQSRGCAEVRERRAMLARGDDAAVVLAGLPVTVEELTKGEPADTVTLFFPRRSPFFKDAAWLASAVVASEESEGPDVAAIEMRGSGGVVRRLWFVRESGAWRFDNQRTRNEW